MNTGRFVRCCRYRPSGLRHPASPRWQRALFSALLLLGFTTMTAGTLVATAKPASAQSVSSSWGIQVQNAGAFWSVSCPDASDCWAAGDGGIMATADAGLSWNVQSIPPQMNLVKGISCPSTSVCYGVGNNSFALSSGAAIITTNAGATWSMEQLPSNVPYLRGIACPDTSTCLAVGGSNYLSQGSSVAVVTYNGGSNWQVVTPGGAPPLYGAACTSPSTCVVVGGTTADGTGVIYQTTNGGMSWQTASTPAQTGTLYGVTCTGQGQCVAVGGDADSDTGQILFSTNEGASWSVANAPAFLPSLFGVSCWYTFCAAGGGNFYHPSVGNGEILISTNAGQSWTESLSQQTLQITGVSCVSATQCWASAHAPSADGTVLGTANAGLSWSQEIPLSPGLDQISCASVSSCVAVGDTYAAWTTDSGAAWYATAPPGVASLSDVSCPSTSYCYASGSSSSGNGVVLLTQDHGRSWKSVSPPGSYPMWNAISCPSQNMCVLAGNTAIFVTINYGKSWQQAEIPSNVTNINTVSCYAFGFDLTCVAGGENSNSASIFLSTSSGNSWSETSAPSALAEIEGVSCANLTTCAAVGSNSSDNYAAAAFTDNGGVNWTLDSIPYYPGVSVGPLSSVSCASTICEAIGGVVYGIGSQVLKSDNDGSSWEIEGIRNSVSAMQGISCPAPGNCYAVGNTVTVVTSTNGVPDGQAIDILPPLVPPSVSSISPSTGKSYGGNIVTLVGSGFLAGQTTVTFSGAQSPSVEVAPGGDSLTAVVPPGSGSANIEVTTPGGSASLLNSYSYVSTQPYQSPTSPSTYHPLTPYRIVDTRPGSNEPYMGDTLRPGQVLNVQVAGTSPPSGTGGIPASGAVAAVLNVTVAGPSASGYLTVWPTDTTRNTVSNLNWTAGDTIANLVQVPLSASGQVSFYNGSSGSTNIVVDVEGYFSIGSSASAGLFVPVAPYRIADTRPSSGMPYSGHTLGPGGFLNVMVAGTAPLNNGAISKTTSSSLALEEDTGVPSSGAEAVVLEVTAIDPSANGYLTVWPTGESMPLASVVDFSPGETIANRLVVPLGFGGEVSIYNAFGSTNVTVDVAGWYTQEGAVVPSNVTASAYLPVAPERVCDTRQGNPSGLEGSATQCEGHTLGTGGTLEVEVEGVGALPSSGITSVVCNVTVTNTTGNSYLTLWPGGSEPPVVSDLNWTPGVTIADLAVVPLSPQGALYAYNANGFADLIVDVEGYYVNSPNPTPTSTGV